MKLNWIFLLMLPHLISADKTVPLNNFCLFIAGSVHNPPPLYFYLCPACIQLEGSLRAYMPTGCERRAWAPMIMRCRSATRTTRHWSSSVWSQGACLKTPVSLPNRHPWALRSWPRTPQRPRGWRGRGPRWENLRETWWFITMRLCPVAYRNRAIIYPRG